MKLVIIDYGSGNLRSAAKAFERAASEAGSAAQIRVTSDAAEVRVADRIVLPGVGAFGDCRRGLAQLPGMLDALDDAVIENGRPFLGICVGMQLMARRGFEHGTHEGLGWIEGDVVPLTPDDPALRIPHMGWNDLSAPVAAHPVLAGIGAGTHLYFVHGYHLRCAHRGDVLAEVAYGGPVTAAVGYNNIVGTQFHPEKSQEAGQRLLANFLAWKP